MAREIKSKSDVGSGSKDSEQKKSILGNKSIKFPKKALKPSSQTPSIGNAPTTGTASSNNTPAKPIKTPKPESEFSKKVKNVASVAGDAKVDLDPHTVQLTLRRINPLSAAKVGFFVSISLGIIMVVAVSLFWVLLDTSGIIFQFSQALLSSGLNTDFSGAFSAGTVAIVMTVIACINVILSTLLALVFAGIYNASAAISGGLKLRFSNR